MATDPVIGWTILNEGDSGAEVAVNELLARILASLTRVIDSNTSTVPGSPSNFDSYIIPAGSSPTGDWSGQAGNIAFYLNGWQFITPVEGMRVRVTAKNLLITYDGSEWTALTGEQTLTDSGGNIDWDLSLGNGRVVLDGNHSIQNPRNIADGQFYMLVIIQDATGSRVPTWGGLYNFSGGTAPSPSAGANSISVYTFYASNGALYLTNIEASTDLS